MTMNTYDSLQYSKSTLLHSFMPSVTKHSHSPHAIRCLNIRRRPDFKFGKFSDPNYVAIFDTNTS
ncbi:hypothetical protein P3S68_011648 [Capsicum galapagoense]